MHRPYDPLSYSHPAYAERWRLDRIEGRPRVVPADEARAHVQTLLASGLSVRAIAEAAKVSPDLVQSLRDGQKRVRAVSARRILSVTREGAQLRRNPRGFVPALGARRRLEALLALGWTHSHITAAMGTRTPSRVTLHQAGEWVTRETFDAVVRAYDALSMKVGPSEITRRRARRLGYAPPLAWDDDDLDDPSARPLLAGDGYDAVDEAAVERAISGQLTGVLTRAERREVVRRLVRLGLTDPEIAKRTGTSPSTIFHDRRALQLKSPRVRA